MRAWLSGVTLLAALAGIGVFFAAGSVNAQSNDTEYCYAGVCYPDQPTAVKAMEDANPNYRGLFKQKSSSIGSASGKLITLYITYTVPDQPPSSILPSVYELDSVSNPAPTYCAASGDPKRPNACASDQELIAGFVNWYAQRYAHIEHTVQGGYFSPFSEVSGFGSAPVGQQPYGLIRHNNSNTALQKSVNVTVFNDDGSIRSGYGVNRPGFCRHSRAVS
jgi:hypothetical protein